MVIGHSFGGLIAQKLLGQNKAAAAIAIDPAPIKGVKPLPIAQLRSAFPVLGNPLNRGRAKALTEAQWRYGFGNALTVEESDALWEQWSIPSPGKPLFEAAIANFSRNSPAKVDTANGTRGPLLITGGTADHTVPFVTAKAAHGLYEKSDAVTDFHEFEGRGHSLTIDHGWRDVADVSSLLDGPPRGRRTGMSKTPVRRRTASHQVSAALLDAAETVLGPRRNRRRDHPCRRDTRPGCHRRASTTGSRARTA